MSERSPLDNDPCVQMSRDYIHSNCFPMSPRDRMSRLKFKRKVSSPAMQEQDSQEDQLKQQVEKCLLHDQPADLICLTDSAIICAKCAIFGTHKGHDIQNLQSITERLTSLAETMLPLYESLKQIQATLFGDQWRKVQELRLTNQKQKLATLIKSTFQKAIDEIRRIEKINLAKLQSSHKARLKKLNQLAPNNHSSENSQLKLWYKEIQSLPNIIESITSLKDIDIKYCNESTKLQLSADGDRFLNLMKKVEIDTQLKVEELIDSLKVTFDSRLKDSTFIGALCQVFEQKSILTPVRSERDQQLPLDRPSTARKDLTFQNPAESIEEKVKQDCMLLSVDANYSFPHSFESTHPHLPNLELSYIRFIEEEPCDNFQQISKFQRTDRSVFRQVENSSNDCQRKKKKVQIVAPQKYKGTIEDLKNDRAEVIDLSGAQLGDSALLILCEYIRKSKRLRILKLIRNKISDEILGEIINACNQARVSSLNLSQNLLSDRSATIIEQSDCQKLKNITLSLNKINRRNVKSQIENLGRKGITLSI